MHLSAGLRHGDVAAEVDATLADTGPDPEQLRALVAALAGIAGHAVQTASYLRLASTHLAADGGTNDALKAFEEQRTAVLYEKPRSIVKCEYVWRRTDRWITFPWSAEPPVGEESAVTAVAAPTRLGS